MQRTFKYFRPETQAWEDVGEWEWWWEAVYNDGSVLKQYDTETSLTQFGNNVFPYHQIREIDQSRLHAFRMVSPTTGQVYTVLFNPQFDKLIHVIKTTKEWHTNQLIGRMYFFGYETLVKRHVFDTDKNEWVPADVVIKVINVITPTGEIITTDDPNKVVLE